MTREPEGEWRSWPIEQLIAAPRDRKAVLVAKGPRPHTVPAQIETTAIGPIAMPLAPAHKLRLLAVRPHLRRRMG